MHMLKKAERYDIKLRAGTGFIRVFKTKSNGPKNFFTVVIQKKEKKKGWIKLLEELLTILYDPRTVRGQHPFNHCLKLDSNSHSLNGSHIGQIGPYIIVYWSPDVCPYVLQIN